MTQTNPYTVGDKVYWLYTMPSRQGIEHVPGIVTRVSERSVWIELGWHHYIKRDAPVRVQFVV